MAAGSLLALLDDIATILDDVAAMSKVAAGKTAGVLGDDLALNAEQVAGVQAERELPVVWAVARGSFRNKLILVPVALLLSALAPWAILPLLMLGGAYLCFEGFEKVAHRLLHSREEDESQHRQMLEAVADPHVDLVAREKEKIAGAIRTDLILSAEIIVIALGTVHAESFAVRAAVVSTIAVAMTVGVYGLVAAIVRLDDLGYRLLGTEGATPGAAFARALGAGVLAFAPRLMKSLSVIGTVAMFLVGGGIILHGLSPLATMLRHLEEAVAASAFGGTLVRGLLAMLANVVVGIVCGGLVLGAVLLVSRLRGSGSSAS